MKKSIIIIIVMSSIIAVLIGVIFIQQGIIMAKDAEKVKLVYQLTQINNDIVTMKDELTKKDEILANKETLLNRVKEANTFKEYISIWKELNK